MLLSKWSAKVLHSWYLHYGLVFVDMSTIQNNLALIFQEKPYVDHATIPNLEKQIELERNKLRELQNKAKKWSKYAQPTQADVDNLVAQMNKLLVNVNNKQLILGPNL